MAKFTFETGKRPEDCVERLSFCGHVYEMHHQRRNARVIESVEQPFFYQVSGAYQMPERVRRALERLNEDVNTGEIAQAVSVLSDYEQEVSHDTP